MSSELSEFDNQIGVAKELKENDSRITITNQKINNGYRFETPNLTKRIERTSARRVINFILVTW